MTEQEWTTAYNGAFEHGISHGLTTAEAMRHADEIMTVCVDGLETLEHDVLAVTLYTRGNGRVAYTEHHGGRHVTILTNVWGVS